MSVCMFASHHFVSLLDSRATSRPQLHTHVTALGEAGRHIIDRLSNFFRLIAVAFVAYTTFFVLALMHCARLLSGLGTGVYFARERPFDLFSPGKVLIFAAALAILLRATVCAKSGADQGGGSAAAAAAAADPDADQLLRAPLARDTDEKADVEMDA